MCFRSRKLNQLDSIQSLEELKIPFGEYSADKHPVPLTLTGTGAQIWNLLDGTNTVQQMIDQVARRYDTPADEVSLDVVAFLEELATARMIAS